MPKYLVEMHDGRKFQVEADSQPSEADVLAHMGKSAPALSTVSADEPTTFTGGFVKSLKDQFSQAVKPVSKEDTAAGIWQGHAVPPSVEKFASTPLAHPTGFDTIDNFTSPAGIATLAAGAAAPLMETPINKMTVGRGMQMIGNNLDITKPAKFLAKAGEALERSGTPAPEPPAPPTGPHLDRTVPMRPSEMTQQQIMERIKFGTGTPEPVIRGGNGRELKGPSSGRLQMAPTERPPMTVSPESPMQAPSLAQQGADAANTAARREAAKPENQAILQRLTNPRVDIGAEAVGRQQGMTKQAVRDTTGPIRGEAQGAAAGMPSDPKDRIVQRLIDMGPKGQGLPESAREAYAAAGTSDKTRLQVQAYLDALRKVGFAGAGATSAEALRQAVMSRLGQEQQ